MRTIVLSVIWMFHAAFQVPPLTGPVVDLGQILRPQTREVLARSLRNLYEQGGTQIVILTVPQLSDSSIEQASIQVTDAWQLGRKGKDDGILLFVAREDRAIRIEIGRGHEGDLTDAYAHRIIEQVIVPRFKTGDFDEGIVAGVRAIVARTDPGADLDSFARGSLLSKGRKTTWVRWIFFLIILAIFFLQFHGTDRVRGPSFGRIGSRRWGSRRWDGNNWPGGGDGGFSGGGGGFSGGGASGKW
jgi:uncharacterized protein